MGKIDLTALRIERLKRAIKAIEVSRSPHLDDGTVKNDVRIKGLLAHLAELTEVLAENGLLPELEQTLVEEGIGEDLVLARLHRRLAAFGVTDDTLYAPSGSEGV